MNHEIKITITDEKKAEITSNIEHDDVVMFYLIEALYELRNKQYKKFTN